MKISSSRKRVAAIGVVTAATLVGGGMAVAYWTAGGTGTGSASTGNSVNTDFTVTVGEDTSATLSPGSGVQQTIPIAITNDAVDAPTQYVTSVLVSIGDVMDGATVKCAASNFKLDGATGPGASLSVPVGVELTPTGTTSVDVKIEMVNKPVNQDSCKDVTVPLTALAS